MRYKAGTQLVCVEDAGADGELTEGLIYVVQGHDLDGLVRLRGVQYSWDPDRFELKPVNYVSPAVRMLKNGGGGGGTIHVPADAPIDSPNEPGHLTIIRSIPVPQIVCNENIRPFDIDDSLILHGDKGHPEYKTITIQDRVENKTLTFRVHEPMVRLLKEEHARGSFIIAWSRSGYQWAADVIEALGLNDKVHLVLSKPMVYFDDSPVENWMKDRVYLPPDAHYKK